MTARQLLDRANSGYPDGYLETYYDDDGNLRPGTGDTLARAIVSELIETFDPLAAADDQTQSAIEHLEQYQRDLGSVIAALSA